MRMPNARQISEEQQDIFEEAPTDGSILVSGPPGTGKTVIAILRAQLLSRKKQDVVVLMFNRVLRRYTENAAEKTVVLKTMHSWLPEWWKMHKIPDKNCGKTLILEDRRVYVNCPFKDRVKIKTLGGKWNKSRLNPFTYANGMWYVFSECYNANPDLYSQWIGYSYEPPQLKRWHYNWADMKDWYLELSDDEMVDWGHLIIDEAQDFEPGFYSFLHIVGRQLSSGGLTILADENQRLEEEKHSSLQDIRKALKLNNKPDREFHLTKNFRNTRQIAEVSRSFYVGLDTGIPELPDRSGDKPVLFFCSDTQQQIERICHYLRFRGALEVGIIVGSESDREFFVQQLSNRLKNYTVQSYSSNNYKSSNELIFDKQGVITVLHRKSCKGLEFDTVFVPQLQSFSVSDTDFMTFKMNMYVICSRARMELVFMCNGGQGSNPAFFQHFPSQESGLIDYREQK